MENSRAMLSLLCRGVRNAGDNKMRLRNYWLVIIAIKMNESATSLFGIM